MSHSTAPHPLPLSATSDQEHQQQFRRVMAELPAGVTVLTTMSPQGPVGMTTSAFTSLSMEPPLVLACLHHRSGTLAAIIEHGAFAVNVLADSMDHISRDFAEKPLPDRFTGVPHHHQDTVPVLRDAIAWITCRIHATHPGGDHTILIGTVTRAGRRNGEPLLRHRGAYRRFI
ncbi:flavin reductase family protein [Streptomyces sp. IB2014 016-6]|uniref:flavin reductase family protein n=1 Tax=Streptomyces sp. IB2014 016-6 TaxID=2517818 RepID=UPI0011CA00B3|nr:flavin reductase family protein [Streptomyces sp. IB2014 016-6]TXL83704.1 flavin reductase [Streptomyces sp. IB2014 016-6]